MFVGQHQNHPPRPLASCSECRRPYQLRAGVHAALVRPHFINPFGDPPNPCPGSGKPPLPGDQSAVTVVHYLVPGREVLACCGRAAGEVSAGDRFSLEVCEVTCSGQVRVE